MVMTTTTMTTMTMVDCRGYQVHRHQGWSEATGVKMFSDNDHSTNNNNNNDKNKNTDMTMTLTDH